LQYDLISSTGRWIDQCHVTDIVTINHLYRETIRKWIYGIFEAQITR